MQRKTVAVCIICKNEEALIARALESVKSADAIFVCDTGSQDDTIEIVKKYTPNVCLSFVWTDSFCDAQNHCKEHAKGYDWILSLDADEYLDVPFDNVRKAVELAQDTVRVQMIGEGGGNEFGFPRLFRNTPEIYWCQDIHKHLSVPGEGEPVGNVRIVYGHSPAHELDPDRSLRMLERAVETEENPVRNLYYLGREYWYKQRYQEAINTLQRYFKIAHAIGHRLDEVADAYLITAQCYAELKKPVEMSDAVLNAIKINPNFKEAVEFMRDISIDENKEQWARMARYANNEGVLWKRTEVEPKREILIAVHNDDESLFCGYTLLRKHPLVIVVTDSYIQHERGDIGCDAESRRRETQEAMKIAGCDVIFFGIKDTELQWEGDRLERLLKKFDADTVYAPAVQGGNAQHDFVSNIAKRVFGDTCVQYTTYTKTELYTTGRVEIIPNRTEIETKEKMLNCYKSQLALQSTLPHFWAVRGKSEWYL